MTEKLSRLCILPLISTRVHAWRESDFVVWHQFAEQWKDTTIIMPVNKDAVIPEHMTLPNMIFPRLEYWQPFAAAQAQLNNELYNLFNPINGEYQVDAILTSKDIVAANVKRMFEYSSTLCIPVCIGEYWVPEPTNHDNPTQAKLQCVSWSECPTFFPTHREKKFAMQKARKFMSPSSVAQMDKIGIVRSQGIKTEIVQSIARETEKFDKHTYMFAARFNSNKRWAEVLDAFEDIFKMGRDIQIKAIYPNDSVGIRDLERFEKVEYIKPLPYDEYLKLLCQCHVMVSMSDDEGFSFGWSEQLCTGNPVLFPDKDWVFEHVRDRQYPWIYRNKLELLAMLRWIEVNYEEARAKSAPYVEHFIANHDIKVSSKAYMERLQSTLPGTWMEFREWHEKFLDVLTNDMPDEFTMEEFTKVAGKKYKAQFGNYVVIIGAHRNLHRWLIANAGHVVGQNKYKKVK